MSTLEQRVRAAARAAADTVAPDSVPPLRLPSGNPGRPRGGARSSASVWARRLAPLGAAMAVVALAVAMVNLSSTVRRATAPASSPPQAASGGMTTGPSLASYVASGLVPAYYLSIVPQGSPKRFPSYAVVRSTATGAALATIMATGGGMIVAATAAADDKTFVLDEQPWVHTGQEFAPRTFVLVRLGASGQPGPLTRLPISLPAGAQMTGFALSPDGSQLAIAVRPGNVRADPNLQQIWLYTLSTGELRTWSANGFVGTGPDDVRSLSWTTDERTLAFNWGGSGASGVRLLNLRARGSSLLADSRQAAMTTSPNGVGWSPPCPAYSVITPDGTTLVCATALVIASRTGQYTAETEFLESSASTGSVTRILGHWTIADEGGLDLGVMWSNASGSVLIGIIPDAGLGRVGVIRGNQFTLVTTSPAYADTW
jgi:hypothetical protein